jgi:hypothetical protein
MSRHWMNYRLWCERTKLKLSTVVAAPATTWSTTDKHADIALSSGNLTATRTASTGATYCAVRSTTSKSSGKWVFAVDPLALTTPGNVSVGVANASQLLNIYLGNSNNSVSLFANGQVWRNAAAQLTVNSTSRDYAAATSEVMVAVDLDNKRIWFKTDADPWNGDATANPATNVGGVDITLVTGALFAAVNLNAVNDAFTVNLGATAFTNTIPSGFTAWNG